MKWIAKFFVPVVLVVALAGCTADNGGKGPNSSGSLVDQVIHDQISAGGEESGAPGQTEPAAQDEHTESAARTEELLSTPVDYDLTVMSSDMVYATVYQLMFEPDNYVGKTVRIKGLYYVGYYEPTGQYYHYCIIQDALACCAQGLEFVWDDGSHIYPDEYPAEETEIMVQGVFDVYYEEESEYLYCRLKDAVMQVDVMDV